MTLINKAHECNPKNESYLFEKTKHLIRMKNYDEAKKTLKTLSELNSYYLERFPMYGVLEMKDNNFKNGEKELKRVYKNLSKINFRKTDFNEFYYYVILKYYFEGKSEALLVMNGNNLYKGEHEKSLFDFF